MLLALPDAPLRTGSFALEDRWLLWARVRVYPDRLELEGWSLTGQYRREIALDQIAEIDHTSEELRLNVTEEESVTLLLDEPARWAHFLQAHCDVHDDPQ